jgi:tartrate-resistant acid phosphatase type 5
MRLLLLLAALSLTPRSDTLRIAVTGDTGDGAETVATAIARVHAASPLDAIILTGDNFYPCGVLSVGDARWKLVQPLTRIGIPIFPVLGNHDSCGKSDPDAQTRATGLIPNWRFPAREYTVRSPLADFAFLDTNPYVKKRNRALESTLADAFLTSGAKWRIVIGHHPILSSGYHGYFPRAEVQKMRDLIPLMHTIGADVYICGHDHHLELIRGRTLFLISGAGSEPIPPIKLRVKTVFPQEIRPERIGFAVVEITAKRIRVRMYDGGGRAKSEWIEGRAR